MQITRSSVATRPGPSEWFTGSVYIDSVAEPSGASRVSASSVHFTPGARTAWHRHPNGQTIYVTEGIGLAQSRGGADLGEAWVAARCADGWRSDGWAEHARNGARGVRAFAC